MAQKTVPPRSAIAAEHTWDLASVFATDAAWEAEFARVAGELASFDRFKSRLGSEPGVLLEYLQAAENTMNAVWRVYLYASMQHDTDTTDAPAKARYDRSLGLAARAAAALAFGEPEMLAIDADTLRGWMAENPKLAVYEHYFDRLALKRAHVRSAEVEELLGQVRDPFRSAANIHGVLTDADLRFAPAHSADDESNELAQGNLNALLTSADRDTRHSAWESYADAHLATKNTMAACLATGVKQNVFLARARRYTSALEAATAADNIPTAVFHSLIATFQRNLPTWHRYWRLRRRALGYDTLHPYDVKAPLTGAMPNVSFAQAVEWICAGMQPLGEEYVATMRRGLTEQRWVDIYPNKGKRMGAYQNGVAGTHPFILMSYTDDIFSMSTLAHELGHAMHSYFTWRTQPLVYADYSIFVAEVASNFNQAMVRAHLLETETDPDFQIAVIEEAMANFHRYFFVMPTLARFELAIHEQVERGEALTAEGMIDLMASLFAEGYGDEVAIDRERVGMTWGQFSTHLYSNFYVYQYATGISAAHALAANILAGQPGAAERYLGFLKAGESRYPIDVLRDAGVDMTTPEAVETTFATLASYVDRLEGLLDRRGV
jgi:oligoendopeptidase F